jgi:hypothetical protein
VFPRVILAGEDAMPSLRSVFSNMGAPMPLSRKLERMVVNNWTKIRTLSNCCDHPGEPGC